MTPKSGLDKAVLLIRTQDNVGYLVEIPSGSVTIEPIFSETRWLDPLGFQPSFSADFAGFDIALRGGHKSTMTVVANFDDLFNRVRQDADTTERGLPAATPELENPHV